MKIYNIYSQEYESSFRLEKYFLSEENAKKAITAMQEEDEFLEKKKIHFKLNEYYPGGKISLNEGCGGWDGDLTSPLNADTEIKFEIVAHC